LATDKVAYYQFLNKIFPSNYSQNKINKIKRRRLNFNNTNNKKHAFKFEFDKTKKRNKKKIFMDGSDEEDEEYGDNDYSKKLQALNKLKTLLNIPGNSQKTENTKKDNNINIVLSIKDERSEEYGESPFVLPPCISSRMCGAYTNEENYYDKDEDEDEDEDGDDDEDEYGADEDIMDELNDQNFVLNNEVETNANARAKPFAPVPKHISAKNYRDFSKILTEEDNESEYFKNKLSVLDQRKYIKKLQTIKDLTSVETPYLIHLMNLDIPDVYKACALRKINMLRSMGGGFGNSEYYKIKSWVDAFIKIPFNKINNLPITFADGINKCHDFMEDAKKTLDSVVYGLDDAKIQIMQLIGLWLVNPNAIGSAIAIKGPMGTGKTTLIKDGISKILNRPFALIALGGCGDSGFLDGHDYTYEGSKYGKIIDILIQAGSMNPVILFDELDKISDSPKGEEITGVLTHLTDATQNTKFSDKYMSEISLDMSKALYIFSYNDESRVNPILKDRMYKIETKGYKTKDKLVICKDYLLPKICEQAKFEKEDIVLDDDVLEYIINEFTDKESGVRNLKRCLEIIYTKLNLYRLMKPDINLFESTMDLKEKIVFPITVKRGLIDKLINKSNTDKIPFGMYN
jgi:ATP-dependent Lon protease